MFPNTYSIKALVFFTAFVAILASMGVLACSGSGVQEQEPVAGQQTPILSNLSWADVTSWKSTGTDDSPPFHISAETWRVLWVAAHAPDGSFAVHVYKPNGLFVVSLYDTADDPDRNFDGPLRGVLRLGGPGDFFLRIKTARDYEVTVQELR